MLKSSSEHLLPSSLFPSTTSSTFVFPMQNMLSHLLLIVLLPTTPSPSRMSCFILWRHIFLSSITNTSLLYHWFTNSLRLASLEFSFSTGTSRIHSTSFVNPSGCMVKAWIGLFQAFLIFLFSCGIPLLHSHLLSTTCKIF